jgi:hypothetical protein
MQTALRYYYQAGDPVVCAACHSNLASNLMRKEGLQAEVLAHRLAGAVIAYQTASGYLTRFVEDVAGDLKHFTAGGVPLPGDFAALCEVVGRVEGVDLASLFAKLPTTRAASGDEALRHVLDQAHALPEPDLPPVFLALLTRLHAAAEEGQDPGPILQAFRMHMLQSRPGGKAAIDALIANIQAHLAQRAGAGAGPAQ